MKLYFSTYKILLLLMFMVQLSGCSNSINPKNEYQSVAYSSPVSKTVAKSIDVAEFSGVGITALHAYLPIGSQVDVVNPVTNDRVSAKVIGRTAKNKQTTLFVSPEAAKILRLRQYPHTKMLMRMSRKTNYSTWPSRVQKKLTSYVPKGGGVIKGVLESIPRYGSKFSKPQGNVGKVQNGVASYYARRFHGRKTASGARYNMYAMTCAHRTLPFGTKVRVTNQNNGRSVVLKVNDRGPFSKGRIVDVSLAAAKKLGMIKRGTASVKLEVFE